MCAQFLIKAKFEELKRKFGLVNQNELEWMEHILPYRPAPVIVQKPDGYELKLMNFSLVPHWAKEPKVKFATHNARLETIAEKPTWKNSFRDKRCLVPLSDFIEPIYEGEFAGNMVAFHRKDEKPLVAAGIYDEWVNKETGELLESFSIITHEPSEYIEKMGHDREPVFLTDETFESWTDPTPQKSDKLFKLIEGGLAHPDFDARKFRELKRKKKP